MSGDSRLRGCRWCAKPIPPKPGPGNLRQFCSDSCKYKLRDRRRKIDDPTIVTYVGGEDAARFLAEMKRRERWIGKELWHRLCTVCGGAFVTPKPKRTTCSAECCRIASHRTDRRDASRADGQLLASCWCDRTAVLVDSALVRQGLTGSCGRAECNRERVA